MTTLGGSFHEANSTRIINSMNTNTVGVGTDITSAKNQSEARIRKEITNLKAELSGFSNVFAHKDSVRIYGHLKHTNNTCGHPPIK